MKTLIACALLLPLSAVARDHNNDFKSLVQQVEQHYGKRRLHIPTFGLLSLASLAARPLGVSDFKFAVISGIDANSSARAPEFQAGPDWRPVVRVTDRNGEHVVIYGRDEGATAIRALMLVVDHDDAVVMQMRMHPSRFAKFIAEKARQD